MNLWLGPKLDILYDNITELMGQDKIGLIQH